MKRAICAGKYKAKKQGRGRVSFRPDSKVNDGYTHTNRIVDFAFGVGGGYRANIAKFRELMLSTLAITQKAIHLMARRSGL